VLNFYRATPTERDCVIACIACDCRPSFRLPVTLM